MSQINVDTIKNKTGSGAPNFPNGATITGILTATTFKGAGTELTGTASNLTVGNATSSAGLTGTPSVTVRDITANNITGAAATFTGNVAIGGVLQYEDVTNIDSVGVVTAREGVSVPDDKKLIFGASQDLQMWHDAGAGCNLRSAGTKFEIRSPDLQLQNSAAEKYIRCQSDAGVEIYDNNVLKIETAQTGAVVTGILTATTSVKDSKGDVRSIPQNIQTGAYTLVASDAGKHIYNNSTGSITVPPTSGVFNYGDAITILNGHASGSFTILQGSGVTIFNSSDGSTGTRTLAAKGMCTLICVASNGYFISGAGLS